MRRIILFVEDFGHQEVITSLVTCVAHDQGVDVSIRPYSVRGGHGRAISDLAQFVRDVKASEESWPDLLVVAIDANCRGYRTCRREVESHLAEMPIKVVLAIPDPHIERWLLLDSSAFKSVWGRGCTAPDYKCDRSRYKGFLAQAVREAGLMPLIGGLEHARDIVQAMDRKRMIGADKSLGRFLQDLQQVFKEWSKA
jgi:hypothetical protein